MFELNSNKLIRLLFWALILFVTGCTQKWESNHADIFTTPPAVTRQSPAKVNINLRKNPEQRGLVYNKTGSQGLSNNKAGTEFQDVWPRILDQFVLMDYDNPRIDKEVKYLLSHPQFLSNVQKRAEPYLYHIIEEVEFKQIPGEMALLPVVESGFKTHALSRSSASGL